MNQDFNRSFNSKILLFGEYSLMKGSMALSMPFSNYTGRLFFDLNSGGGKSNHYSVKYLIEFLDFLRRKGFGGLLDLEKLENDISRGLLFETNIPISYGLGSSGVIVASIYYFYAKTHEVGTHEFKNIFSEMEAFYHGKSSGLDPLVSYFNKAVLLTGTGEITTVEIPRNTSHDGAGLFLIDSRSKGETQPLVSWFLDEYEKEAFKNKIDNKLIPINNQCIKSFLENDFETLSQEFRLLSEFTFNNFRPMVPDSLKDVWEKGLKTGDYSLKLCGSGGGGMVIGFTHNFDMVKKELNDRELIFVHSV